MKIETTYEKLQMLHWLMMSVYELPDLTAEQLRANLIIFIDQLELIMDDALENSSKEHKD